MKAQGGSFLLCRHVIKQHGSAVTATTTTLTVTTTTEAMAQPPGSPEDLGRQTTLPWTPGEGGESLMQAIQALETYKKKDPSKGSSHVSDTEPFHLMSLSLSLSLSCGDSGRAFQGCRQCPDHEAKLLQDHGCQPVSSSDSVFEKGVGVESGGAVGMEQFSLSSDGER